jgi:hypothetical protein
MALASVTKLRPDEIQSLLGTGGMGEVHRAGYEARARRGQTLRRIYAGFLRELWGAPYWSVL